MKTKATGVCMSDWHLMKGDWAAKLPIVLGHEAAGIIEEVGPGVFGLKPGDHVIFSFKSNCGQCRYCSDGRTALCNGHNDTPGWMQFDGTSRLRYKGEPVYQMTRIGTFAEAVVCPAEQVVKIRKDMPFAQAALVGCSVATGVGAVIRHAKIEPGSSVLVIGCGGVGLNIVQGARLAGAKDIMLSICWRTNSPLPRPLAQHIASMPHKAMSPSRSRPSRVDLVWTMPSMPSAVQQP